MPTLIVSLLVAILITVTFAIHTNWYFNGSDDFHCLYLGAQANNSHDLIHYFYDGNTNQDAGPTNHVRTLTKPSFLGVYYRPLHLIIITLQYWLFHVNAYWYFLCAVLFHIINTLLLFYLLLYFTTYLPALFAALFFAFHPQIAYRFGFIANIQYYLNLTLILCILLTFKYYLDRRKLRYNILACILFGLSLFLRETAIILPAIIMVGALLYQQHPLTWRLFWKKLPSYVVKTSGLWLVAYTYLGVRLSLYPLSLPTAGKGLPNVINLIATKLHEGLVCLYDSLWLSWLPWGNKLLRVSIMIPLLSLLLWLFIKNTRKLYVIFFLLCYIIMLWPGFIGCYSPRYFYEAAPFLITAVVLLFIFYKNKHKILTILTLSLFILTSMGLILFTHDSFTRREHKMHIVQKAVQNLIKNPVIKDRALCFILYPSDGLGDQPADLFWVMLNNKRIPIYCDSTTAITQQGSNIVTPTKWANVISSYYTQNYIIAAIQNNGIRITSNNPAKVAFELSNQGYSVGNKTIHQTLIPDNQHTVTDFTLTIDHVYLKHNPLIIAWDYAKQSFFILNA